MTLKLSMSANTTATSPPSSGLALDRLGQHAVEQRAVRQVGQRVVVGLVVEPLGVALAGGDVDALGDVVVRAAVVVADQRVAPQDPADAAVGAHVAALGLRARRPAGGQLAASVERSSAGTKSQNHRPSGLSWPVRSRSSRLPCRTRPRGETSAIATGASSNARRKRSSELAVLARLRSLARQETRLAIDEPDDEEAVDAGPAPRVVGVVEHGVARASRPSGRAGARRSRSPAGTPTTPRRARARRPSRSSGSAPRSCRARRRRARRSRTAARSRTATSGRRGSASAQQATAPKSAGTTSNAQAAPSDQPCVTANAGRNDQVRGEHQQQPAMAGGPHLGRKRSATWEPREDARHSVRVVGRCVGNLTVGAVSARSVRRRVTPSAMIETR